MSQAGGGDEGRRGALRHLMVLGGAALGCAVAAPGAVFLVAPLRSSGGRAGQWVRTVRLDALREGEPKKVAVVADLRDAWTVAHDQDLGAVWLLRRGAEVTALSAVCPHLGCAISLLPGAGFGCPCHTSEFAMDGTMLSGPTPRGMDPLETRIDDGFVAVNFQKFRIGIAAPRDARMTLHGLSDWLDERIGHRKLLADLRGHGAPGGGGAAGWSRVLGSALAAVFLVQLVTGLLLMTVYAPNAATAWASVHYVSYRLAAGWLVRGLHYFASQAMIVLVGAHLLQTAVAGAYRRPREVTWWLGIALLLLTLGLSHSGFMLPWDQKGYWAARMAMGIAGTTPIVGRFLQELLQGGSDYGSLTLTRLYALHAGLLPLLFLLVLVAHVALVRRHGLTGPVGALGSTASPFHPRQAGRGLAATVVVVAVLFAVVIAVHGAPLDPPADPSADYPARPEWYLVPIFELRRHLHGPLELVATMVVPGIVFGYLFALPLLDRSGASDLRSRLRSLWPLFAGLAGCALLLLVSLRADARDAEYQRARARADALAATARMLAMNGVPPAGPLEMLARDPELRGRSLFETNCSGCHLLAGLGDPKKATAPRLEGWGTEAWVASMVDNPDADERFGHTPFRGMMLSLLHPPADRKPDDPPFKPMTDAEVKAVSVFLASQSDADGPAGKSPRDPAQQKTGESIVSVRCTTCHLWKGEGDDASQGYAPELEGWGSVAWARAQITNPATKATYRDSALDPKLKKHMPRFEGDVAPADVELLARWVVAHAHGRSLP